MPSNGHGDAKTKSLSFKGDSDKKKKKKSKSSSSADAKASTLGDAAVTTTVGDGDAGPSTSTSSAPVRMDKTAAELRFEAIQRQRMADKARKAAKLSHKDRVAEFNSKLERLSEHYDIPKVGPG